MAGEEGGAGRHYSTADRVEYLGSGSGYGLGVYGRGGRASRGYYRGRGFGRNHGIGSWGSDGNHDRVDGGRELRGTITSNLRGNASYSRGNASNLRGIASNSRGMPSNSITRGSASNSYRATGSYTRGRNSNYMGEASNSRSNGSNSSNYRGRANNSGSSTSNSRESAGHSTKCVIETGEVNEDSLRMTSKMESFEYALPVEHWMQVFEKVLPKDLCNLALTSRQMNSIATTPELWSRMVVSKGNVKMHGLAQFFNVNRFKKIKQIDFSLMCLSNTERIRLLNDISGSPLQKVNLSYNKLRGVPSEALSKAVAHLKTVNLEDTRLTTSELIAVLKAILSSDFLKDVNLAWNDLHDKGKGVPIDLLCRAVCRLQKVNLAGTSLSAGKCACLVEAILSSESLLDVTLRGNNLSGVSADLLARAVGRLQRVDLTGTSLTAHQSTRILVASLSSGTLRDVTLACADLSKVSADLLARAVGRLQKVNLSWTKLTADQSSAVVDAIISSNSLVEVNLSGIDLSQVPADLLARAVGSLKTVNLKWTKLTADQSSAVVEAIVSLNSLVAVALSGVDLSQVPAHLLDREAGGLP